MDFQNLIERKRARFDELEREIGDPALFDNRKRAQEIMREHSATKQFLALASELDTARRQIEDNRELAMANDAEMVVTGNGGTGPGPGLERSTVPPVTDCHGQRRPVAPGDLEQAGKLCLDDE